MSRVTLRPLTLACLLALACAPLGCGGSQPFDALEPDRGPPVRTQQPAKHLKVELDPLRLKLIADPIDRRPVGQGIAAERLAKPVLGGPPAGPSDGRQAGKQPADCRPVPRIDQGSQRNQARQGQQEIDIVPDQGGRRT